LSLVVRIGVVSVAAVLAALSTVVILSFAVSALGQPDGVAFFLVGRGIWRDLRRRSSVEPEERPTEERGR
jgi:hypothetical protein